MTANKILVGLMIVSIPLLIANVYWVIAFGSVGNAFSAGVLASMLAFKGLPMLQDHMEASR